MNQCYDVYKYIYDRYSLDWQDIFFKGSKIGRANNIKFLDSFGFIGIMELKQKEKELSVMGKIVSIKFSEVTEEENDKIILRASEVYIWRDDHASYK